MSRKLDDELRAAFAVASDFIEPPRGLADNARRGSRERRRKLLDAIAACALVLAVAAAVYASSSHYRATPTPVAAGPHSLVTVGYPVSQVAVSGPYLYLASNQSALVAAYDRRTGKLVRLATVPGGPDWLAVGPGGRVWADVEGDASPGALLLFSPGLAARATGASLGGPVMPTSRQTALAPTQYGLLEVRMPAPGQPGRASQRLVSDTSLGPSLNTAPGAWAGLLDGRVAVQVTNGYGYDSHLVIAGDPGRTFGGDLQHQVGAVTSAGGSLWVQMFAIRNSYAASAGPLARADGQLRATTPVSIQRNPVLARTENVWSAGSTVWVATAARGHALVCFAGRGQAGPVITVQARGSVATVAATTSTVYVVTVQGDSFGPSLVTSYPVPAACR
jgi:hypothetical protein